MESSLSGGKRVQIVIAPDLSVGEQTSRPGRQTELEQALAMAKQVVQAALGPEFYPTEGWFFTGNGWLKQEFQRADRVELLIRPWQKANPDCAGDPEWYSEQTGLVICQFTLWAGERRLAFCQFYYNMDSSCLGGETARYFQSEAERQASRTPS